MIPRAHQTIGAAWALDTVRKHGLAYLSWQERTGKTLTALLTVEHSKAKHCLIVTKKKAISGWDDTLSKWPHTKKFDVINYESLHKLDPRKYDFIIIDEAHHAISGIGRASKTWKTAKRFTIGKPILYLSATPYAEHIGLIYRQLKLSDWTPLPQKNFYDFFRKYGISHMTRTPYGLVETYTKYKTQDVLVVILHLFNFKTRADVGIEVEPQIRVITIKPSLGTQLLMQKWISTGVIEIDGEEIFGDSGAKKRTIHYQLEGGTVKLTDRSVFRSVREKIDYIKENYDTGTIAIMAHFVAERELLSKELPNAIILSSDGDAEGVDLSHINKLLVYSMSFKTSKHTQRIARQANHNRKSPIIVDILVMGKPGIGRAVYDTVAVKKENFVKASYELLRVQ